MGLEGRGDGEVDRAHPLHDRGRELRERRVSESLANLGCPLGRIVCGVERSDGFLPTVANLRSWEWIVWVLFNKFRGIIGLNRALASSPGRGSHAESRGRKQ